MNSDTDRLSESLSATHCRRATSPMLSPTPHPIPRPNGRRIKQDNKCLLSNIISHPDPASGVTTLALLVGYRQGFFCVGTRGYGVPANENDKSIVCMSV